jgi:hypothetical protein
MAIVSTTSRLSRIFRIPVTTGCIPVTTGYVFPDSVGTLVSFALRFDMYFAGMYIF